MENLFVYGTLLDKRIEREVFSDMPKSIIKDSLWHHSLVNVDISKTERNYLTIVPDPEGVVNGEILFISEIDLQEADNWENNYERIEVELVSGITAWVYRMKEIIVRISDSIEKV